MNKKQFIELSGNIHVYRILKRLPDELSQKQIGDKIQSSTLFDKGYNILKLVEHGYIKNIDEPYEWQKELVDKNEHSVYCYCPECRSFGINGPLNNKCGNCGYEKGITYYDAQTLDVFINSKLSNK